MALSGSFSTNKYSGDIGLKLSWTGTQSIANNTTTIKWTLASEGGRSGNWWYAGPVKVVINSKTVLNTTSRFKMHGSGGYKKTGSITVSHNTDGSKSVSMSVKAAIYSTSVNCTGSKSFTLNKINRYALISAAENFTDEGNPLVTFTNPAGKALANNLKVRIKWLNTQQTEQTTGWKSIPEASWDGGSYRISLTDAERNQMRAACPTSNTLDVTFDLQSTLVSTATDYHSTKAAVMNIVNANPTPGAVSYRDSNASVVAITGSDQIIVQKQSGLVIATAQATAKKGATITGYWLYFNGTNYDITQNRYYGFPNINLSGTYKATVTSRDSRGNTSTNFINIQITGWTTPTAEYSIKRRDNFYDETIFNVDGKISSIKNSEQQEKNTMTIKERHQQKGTSTWSSWIDLPDAQDYSINLANTSEWIIEIKVSDAFSTTTYTTTVGKGIPIMFWDRHRHSVGVNGLPDADDQLYVGGNIKTPGGLSCNWINDRNISTVYTITKVSGNWDIYSKTIWRSGSTVQADFIISGNGTAVSAGTDGYVGKITAGPLPLLYTRLLGMSGPYILMGYIDPNDSTIHFRPVINNFTLPSTGRLHFYGTYIV